MYKSKDVKFLFFLFFCYLLMLVSGRICNGYCLTFSLFWLTVDYFQMIESASSHFWSIIQLIKARGTRSAGRCCPQENLHHPILLLSIVPFFLLLPLLPLFPLLNFLSLLPFLPPFHILKSWTHMPPHDQLPTGPILFRGPHPCC